MAYRNATLIIFLLIGTSCIDQDQIHTNEFEKKYQPALERWQKKNEERLLESLTLLTEITYSYLDGDAPRNDWQKAWHQAHRSWLQSVLLGFFSEANQIDAWPISPGFLDSIDDYPETGIVNDLSIDISSQVIRKQHKITDSSEVSLGFHVLEYYAFSRPEKDLKETDEISYRRRLLIRLVAEMLLLEASELIKNQKPQNRPLLERLLVQSHTLLSEFNRSGEHGQFSDSSLTNISVQLKSINTLMQKPIAFSNYLRDLDKELTKIFIKNLYEAIELSDSPSGLSEAHSSRLLLLLSSLSHQLEDFLRLSKRRNLVLD